MCNPALLKTPLHPARPCSSHLLLHVSSAVFTCWNVKGREGWSKCLPLCQISDICHGFTSVSFPLTPVWICYGVNADIKLKHTMNSICFFTDLWLSCPMPLKNTLFQWYSHIIFLVTCSSCILTLHNFPLQSDKLYFGDGQMITVPQSQLTEPVNIDRVSLN